jgi:hypothetical protein
MANTCGGSFHCRKSKTIETMVATSIRKGAKSETSHEYLSDIMIETMNESNGMSNASHTHVSEKKAVWMAGSVNFFILLTH